MADQRQSLQEKPIFRYVIASAELRYIERVERQVFLARDTEGKPVVVGKVPGCGSDCDAELGQIILEYLMSNEGSSAPAILDQAIQVFCDQIGNVVVGSAVQIEPDGPVAQHASLALEILLRSVSANYSARMDSDTYMFDLNQCPICASAKYSGMQRGADQAHQVFYRLCTQVVGSISASLELEWGEAPENPGHRSQILLRQLN
jgi:hypothetical protein